MITTAALGALISKIPGKVYLVIIGALLVFSAGLGVKLALVSGDLAKEMAAHSDTKLSQAKAENRSLLNLSERYITLGNELTAVRNKGAQNEKELSIARAKLASYLSGLRPAPTASELERDFRAAGYDRASTYAAGVEGVYRSCRKEYIDLGTGVGGAAEAANAAHAQKNRADAIVRALPPVKPIPPVK